MVDEELQDLGTGQNPSIADGGHQQEEAEHLVLCDINKDILIKVWRVPCFLQCIQLLESGGCKIDELYLDFFRIMNQGLLPE